ncbi:MAG: polysaccharide biosynthesis tyrosine autokinase [Burkholderiales bacterium]|nr:polysaccharide biosynthesis tyrosine autokinase [Burkholderiales bacterium]
MNAHVLLSEFPSDAAGSSDGRSIGDIIRQTNNLSAEQVEKILNYQLQEGVRFGEAAVALGFAKQEDVLWALSQQFHYPYSNQATRKIGDELVVATKPFSNQAEVFRAMRSEVLSKVFNAQQPSAALAVISPDTGDGKSYFAANIAASFSQLGGRTLLIDANMRHPRQHEIFSIPNISGLSGILSGRNESKVVHSVAELPSLHVMPAGVIPPNPLELLERPAFGLMIKELLKSFNHIIVDSPSASLGSDARVLAAHCGSALAVCRRDRTRADAMHALLTPMSISSSIKLVGMVVNEF